MQYKASFMQSQSLSHDGSQVMKLLISIQLALAYSLTTLLLYNIDVVNQYSMFSEP